MIFAFVYPKFLYENDGADIEVANRKGNPLIKIYELSKWQDMLTLVMWCWTVILAP